MDYRKMNKCQTPITEELRTSVPREVWDDLLLAIDSIQFIQNLIAPEEVRGYVKDRPKDDKGRVIVNLTNPHILENMDYFRERALFYEENHCYTHLRPNPNPRSEYAEFWREEVKRWEEGLIRPDGEWIPGYYYFYLNYCPIWLNEVIEVKEATKNKAKRVKKFPKVWLGDYLFFHYIDQARNAGAHCKLLKTRGIGFSYKTASISPCNMYTQPGLPNFHLASDKTFLEGEKGIFGKVVNNLDWIATRTPFPRIRLINRLSDMEIQIGYLNEYGNKEGLLSSVYGISLKDNPDKARGVRGPLIHYEEDGLFKNLEKAWSVNRKAVEDGDNVYGLMYSGGCVCEGTKVWDNNGKLTTIENIDKTTGILGYCGEFGSKEDVTYIQEESYKDCVEIITESGGYLKCSTDHPLLMSNKGDRVHRGHGRKLQAYFKKAKELKVGDSLLLATNINVFGNKKLKDAYLIGMMLGDGSYGKNSKPTLSITTEEVYKWISSNYDIGISKLRGTSNDGIYAQVYFLKSIKNSLIEAGIYGQTGKNKRLPRDIHEYDKKSICELLGGYFEANGNIQLRNYNRSIKLTCKYKEMLEDVQYLLLKLGINSSIVKEEKGSDLLISKVNNKSYKMKKYNCYVLYITFSDYVQIFKENIHFKSKYKQERLDSFDIDKCKSQVLINDVYFNFGENKKGEYFKDKPELKNLQRLRIKEINYIGRQRIYNLTANTTHTYLTNRFISANTGGTFGSSFEGSEKLFRNPKAHNIYSIPNVFDKNSEGKVECGFFWGAYLNRANCYDNINGEPDVIKALLEIFRDRFTVKYNSSDPLAITQKKAEEPITPAEAVMRTTGTIYPVADLKEYLEEIKLKGASYYDQHYVGKLIQAQDKIKWEVDNNLYPIRTYRVSQNNMEGAIEIFELPKKDKDHKPMVNRYIAGIDPFDSDQGSSLGSIFIFDTFLDVFVAEYTGRPKFANDFYEICRRMALFYDARIMYESNLKGLYTYFNQMGCLYLLASTPEILKDQEMTKKGNYGNKSLGIHATAEINAYGRRLQRDYLLSLAHPNYQNVDNEGNIISEKLNMHTIRSTGYIEELIAWNMDGNFDRCSAVGMLMIFREERKRFLDNYKTQADPVKEIVNDKYFSDNYKSKNNYSYEEFNKTVKQYFSKS